MVKNFFSDMAIAKTAERTVLDVFSKIAPQYNFTDVSNDRRYFYRGDILTIAKMAAKSASKLNKIAASEKLAMFYAKKKYYFSIAAWHKVTCIVIMISIALCRRKNAAFEYLTLPL